MLEHAIYKLFTPHVHMSIYAAHFTLQYSQKQVNYGVLLWRDNFL